MCPLMFTLEQKPLAELHKVETFWNSPLKEGTPPGKFTCPASDMVITDGICHLSRKAAPAVCINCLIPLADDAHDVARPLCEKCGRAFSYQEGVAGFTTCEHCDLDRIFGGAV